MTLSRLPTRCAHCKAKFLPEERGLRIHPSCVDGWYAANREKLEKQRVAKLRKAKVLANKVLRERKEKLKPVSEWEDECRKIVQKIARIRDRHDGCISCHVGPDYGGIWHGSHYRSVGAASGVQFNLWNIHKACEQCNFFKGGNREGYRPRLIDKIGRDRVEWLDAQNNVKKRSGPEYIEYLKRFKKVMGKRLRRMEKRATE